MRSIDKWKGRSQKLHEKVGNQPKWIIAEQTRTLKTFYNKSVLSSK